MIYYFTGTGNSGYVAKTLANLLGEKERFISSINAKEESFYGDYLGFVFPVYSWGVPPLVLRFIKDLPSSFWEALKVNQSKVWCVMTCGDEVALTPEMFLNGLLKSSGIRDCGIWSVTMPNNYVLLPGFDVDPVNVEQNKLKAVPGRIMEIATAIRENVTETDVVRGSIPWIKTKLVYPLFKKWGVNTRKWHYTPSCIGCGKCAMICPLKNVEMKNGHPEWGTRCCSCLACYHICPYHAVAYGKETANKGQYFFKRNL